MRPYYRFCRFFCQWFCLLFLRVRVHGRENVPRNGAVLLACNHQSFFDPVLATMALPREGNYMARDTLFANPLLGRLIGSLNAFPIRRNSADITAVKETLRRLRNGCVVTTFPEGTRTHHGEIGPFLPGATAVGLRAAATIVPVLIEGAEKSWPRREALPRPASVNVYYGRPFSHEQLKGLSPQEVAHVVRERIIEMRRVAAPDRPRTSRE